MAAYRNDPWVYRPLVRRTLPLAVRLAREDRALAPRLFEAFSHPFAVEMFQQPRLLSRIWISRAVDAQSLCVDAIAPLEPHVPWQEPFLTYRYQCYQARHHPLAARARRDLARFLEEAPPTLGEGLGGGG
jgi:spermidine synthase